MGRVTIRRSGESVTEVLTALKANLRDTTEFAEEEGERLRDILQAYVPRDTGTLAKGFERIVLYRTGRGDTTGFNAVGIGDPTILPKLDAAPRGTIESFIEFLRGRPRQGKQAATGNELAREKWRAAEKARMEKRAQAHREKVKLSKLHRQQRGELSKLKREAAHARVKAKEKELKKKIDSSIKGDIHSFVEEMMREPAIKWVNRRDAKTHKSYQEAVPYAEQWKERSAEIAERIKKGKSNKEQARKLALDEIEQMRKNEKKWKDFISTFHGEWDLFTRYVMIHFDD